MRQRDNTRALARWENEGGTVVEPPAPAGQTGGTP
jgi:hypothetical protein